MVSKVKEANLIETRFLNPGNCHGDIELQMNNGVYVVKKYDMASICTCSL